MRNSSLSNPFLISVAFVLFPFNSLPYFKSVFGELSVEGAFYPLLLGIILTVIFLFFRDKIYLSTHISFYLLLFFIFWSILSIGINIPEITTNYTKGRTGNEKVILQLFLLLFCTVTSVYIYDVLVKNKFMLKTLRFLFLISFFIVGIYSFFEILMLMGNQFSEQLISILTPYIQGSEGIYRGRIRSVSGEASWFAIYATFVFPWLLSYLFTEKRNKWLYFLLNAYLIILLVFSLSRVAYFVFAAQLLTVVFMVCIIKINKINIKKVINSSILTLITCLIMFFLSNLANTSIIQVYESLFNGSNLSNIARFGSQVTALNIAFDNPIFGVGIGQYGFHMSNYIPSWALVSHEIITWMSTDPNTPWAPVHSIYARIMAEQGFVGLLLWLGLWLSLLFSVFNKYLSTSIRNSEIDIYGLIILATIVGVLLAGMNLDTYRYFGYWFIIAISWYYLNKR